MSGLSVFFRDYLPSRVKKEYHATTAGMEVNQTQPPANQEMTDEPIDYNDWRRQRNDYLHNFMEKRVLEGDEDDGSLKEETKYSTAPEEKEDSQPIAEELETQTEMIQGNAEAPQDPFWIPHITETVHVVSFLTDLNLHTKELNLGLCQIDKTWNLREVRRHASKHVAPQRQPIYSSQAQLPRLALHPCEDDGPLCTLYKSVMSMEVRQLNQPQSNVRQRALAMQEDDPTTRRCKIFWYTEYATAMDRIIKKAPKNTRTFYLRLERIPPKCIVPYGVEDWFDRHDLASCCICVGDRSGMKVDVNGRMVRIRFDEAGMKICVGWVDKNNAVTEWNMTPSVDGVKVECVGEDGALAEQYKVWKAQQEPPPPAAKGNEPQPPAEEPQKEKVDTVPAGKEAGSEVDHLPPKKPKLRRQLLEEFDNELNAPDTDMDAEDTAPAASTSVGESGTVPMDPNEPEKAAEELHAPTADAAQEEIDFPDAGDVDDMEGLRSIEEGATTMEKEKTSSTEAEPQAEAPAAPEAQDKDDALQKEAMAQSKDNVSHSTASAFARVRGPPAQEADGSPSRQKHREHVQYYHLNDLRSIYESHKALTIEPGSDAPVSCIVDVYGVVLGFGSPSQTKRGDWMMLVALVDDSLPLAEEEDSLADFVQTVNVNIFTKDKEALPKISYAGDVLRLHRVKLQEWQGDMQLMGMRPSSYVVFRGDVEKPADEQEWSVLPTAKSDFSWTAKDKSRFIKLWKWGRKRLFSHATMKRSLSFKLSDMQRQDHSHIELSDDNIQGDLTLLVTAVIPVPPERRNRVTPRGFLRVWDGTGLPASDPLPLTTPAASRSIMRGDPPPEALIKIASIIKQLQQIRQNENLQPPKALTGRVANVAIWEDSHWELVSTVVKVGTFIRLRNVQDRRMEDSGLRCLMVLSKSYLTPLPSMTYEVVHLLEEHNDRLLRKEPINPQSGILPLDTDEIGTSELQRDGACTNSAEASRPQEAAAEPASNAASLATLLSGPVPSVFSGTTRIVGTIPSLSSLSSSGLQQICALNGQERFFRFAVRLEDESTKQIDAIVGDTSTAGELLFGMSAFDALQDPSGALYNLETTLAVNTAWKIEVRSISFEGAKYFLLESLKEM